MFNFLIFRIFVKNRAGLRTSPSRYSAIHPHAFYLFYKKIILSIFVCTAETFLIIHLEVENGTVADPEILDSKPKEIRCRPGRDYRDNVDAHEEQEGSRDNDSLYRGQESHNNSD